MIKAVLNCRRCVAERVPTRKRGTICGLTDTGIRVWCTRHDELVADITPEGLAQFIAAPPACELCARGAPGHVH